jgi:hypothetical protein
VDDPGRADLHHRTHAVPHLSPAARLRPGGSPTTNIVITGNRFGQNYYAKSGQYGPVAYFAPAGTGNTWSGNIWDTTAKTVASS